LAEIKQTRVTFHAEFDGAICLTQRLIVLDIDYQFVAIDSWENMFSSKVRILNTTYWLMQSMAKYAGNFSFEAKCGKKKTPSM
jgi:hypothetical protein